MSEKELTIDIAISNIKSALSTFVGTKKEHILLDLSMDKILETINSKDNESSKNV